MPILSGFLPIPLAMMIPFMGAQSLVLGKAFGEGFQYGKRKISAMTNEEFNKLTPSDIAANSRRELRDMIPSMKASITDMRDFQSFIVHELIATAKQLPDDIFSGITGQKSDSVAGEAFNATVGAFLPSAFADEGPAATRDFSYLKQISTANLKKRFAKEKKDILLKQAIFKELELRKLNAPAFVGPIEQQKITESKIKETSTGVVQQIALLFNQIIQFIRISKIPGAQGQRGKRQLIIAISTYNRYVQRNRKAHLSIDSRKTLEQLKIVKK